MPQPSLELLESRIAPASLHGNVLSYTDIDGDKVSVIFSKGTLTPANFLFNTGGVDGTTTMPQQLELIDIHLNGTTTFTGASITEKVTHAGAGDGLAAIGGIDAVGVALGKVSLQGDLGYISATAPSASQPALASLAAASIGAYGLRTQAAATATLESDIQGSLGALSLGHDFSAAYLHVTGSIGSIAIGQSLVGGAGASAGEITSGLNMGNVLIGGDLQGGTGANSGYLFSAGNIANVVVRGSIRGGANANTGTVEAAGNLGHVFVGGDLLGATGTGSGYIESDGGKIAGIVIAGSVIGGAGSESGCAIAGGGGLNGNIGNVVIGHDIIGGSGINSGYAFAFGSIGNVTVGGSIQGGPVGQSGGIYSQGPLGAVVLGGNLLGGAGEFGGGIHSGGTIKSVFIGGSVVGGTASFTGEIATQTANIGTEANIGPVVIRHNLVGGGITGTQGNLIDSGILRSGGQIASVFIGGSVIAGVDQSTAGSLDGSGSIRAAYDIPVLRVGGSLIGSHTADGDSPVVISAKGQEDGASPKHLDSAFGAILIGHDVLWTEILGGYNTSLTAQDGNAQIGSVVVGGNWTASSLVSGVQNPAGPMHFGQNDTIIPPQTTANSLAHIASIIIGGSVIGDATATNGTDQFAFSSNSISLMRVHGVTETAPQVNLSPITGDVLLQRLALIP